jgi:glycogen synthase
MRQPRGIFDYVLRLLLLGATALPISGNAAKTVKCPNFTTNVLAKVIDRPKSTYVSEEFARLEKAISKLTPEEYAGDEKGIKVVMAAVELGKVPGLKTVSGKVLSISAGGVSTVMDDLTRYYPHLLKSEIGADLTVVGMLMGDVSKEGMTHVRNIKVKVDGEFWDVGVFEYRSPDGAKFVFLDNPEFSKRITATPVGKQSVYTMRGIDITKDTPEWQKAEYEIEQQKVWSAFNQAVADVTATEKADIFVPHDHHVAPASFYIDKRTDLNPLALKPIIHNQAYVGGFHIPNHLEGRANQIWNLQGDEMKEYFMHGDMLMMFAPGIRVAEQSEVLSAVTVSKGNADQLNGTHYTPKEKTQIDYFRVGHNTNAYGEGNRPQVNDLLSKVTDEELSPKSYDPDPKTHIRNDPLGYRISHPEVVEHFKKYGYAFPKNPTAEQIIHSKEILKDAALLHFGLERDLRKPLYAGFARMVDQKGMIFIKNNVDYILKKGGQVVLGGPVGDEVGEFERQAFLDLVEHYRGTQYEKNFRFVDGPIKGKVKGLTLGGSDFFIIASRDEPCGLTDCDALFHGSIPIAHSVGGLSKGIETILYHTADKNNQTAELREALAKSFNRYADKKSFQAAQVRATKQTFPIEENFSRFLTINRVEVYSKMMGQLELAVKDGRLSKVAAENLLKDKFSKANQEDVYDLFVGLSMMHPDRQTPMMRWMLETYKSVDVRP